MLGIMRQIWRSTARWSELRSNSPRRCGLRPIPRAAALRRETDEFIDARMASFESVLHKTVSQVRDGPSPVVGAQRLGRGGHDEARQARFPGVAGAWLELFGSRAYSPVRLGVGRDEYRGRSAWKDCDEFAASPAGPPLRFGPRHPRIGPSRGRNERWFKRPSMHLRIWESQ